MNISDPNEFLPFYTSIATFGVATLFLEAPCQLAKAIISVKLKIAASV